MDLRTALQNAMGEALDAVEAKARELSSGTLTPADLRDLDHPYAQRHGSITGADPVLVNKQSEAFLNAWRQEPVEEVVGGLSGAVVNTDPKAEWLHEGTRRMLGRALPEAVEQETEAEVEAIFARHLAALEE